MLAYIIDVDDIIVDLEGDWSAVEEDPRGHLIWRYVRGADLRAIYSHLFDEARSRSDVEFKYHCNSPTHFQRFELMIERLPEDRLRVSSVLIERKPRKQPLSVVGASRGSTIILRCSVCNIFGYGREFRPLDEQTIEQLADANDRTLRVYHGVCPSCTAKLRALSSEAAP